MAPYTVNTPTQAERLTNLLPTNAKARYAAFPQIKMFCDNGMCKQETWWVTDKDALIFGLERICQRSYKCKNCGENTIQYFFIWQEREKDNLFVKIDRKSTR